VKLQHALALLLVAASCSESEVSPEPEAGPKNHRPVMVEIPDTSITVGAVLRLQADGSDSDGDSLAFHGSVGSTLSDWRNGTVPVVYFNRDERALYFSPQAHDRPARWAILWAEDGRGGVDTMTVHVQVS
jgi:hypothetical protein